VYAEERRQAIFERARMRGRVDAAGLATSFAVSMETIRRDLAVLEQHGVVRRVHGGAVPMVRPAVERPVSARAAVCTDEKTRIAKSALAELPDQGAILLDAGTTTARIADGLPPDRELTVVTQSVAIAISLVGRPNLTVMLVGGRLRTRTLAAVDSWALTTLAETLVDVAFIATNGVSTARGLTTPDPAEAAVKRAAVASGRRRVLVADHTKIDDNHLVQFADLTDIDTFITDEKASEESVAAFSAAGMRMVVV
jgi:DeoR family fructose operon transcriptional repressor